jgi:hypothetical protein
MIIRHDFRRPRCSQTDRHPALATEVGDGAALIGFDLVQQLMLPAEITSLATAVTAHAFEGCRLVDLDSFRSRSIYAPLVGPRLDAHDIATRLASVAFHGCLIAVARHLPRPDVVIADLRRACPTATVRILELDRLPDAVRPRRNHA